MEKNGEHLAGEVDQPEKPEKKMSTFYMPLVSTFHLYLADYNSITVCTFDEHETLTHLKRPIY